MRSTPRRSRVQAVLIAAACLVRSSHADAAPAPLPDWGVGKKPADKPAEPASKPGAPAPLPDWDAAKPGKKPARTGKKPVRSKKPAVEEPGEPEAPAETPAETPTEPDAPVTSAEPEPTPTETPATPEPAPTAEPAPAVAVGPDPAELEKKRRTARAEIIVGSVLTVGGLAGVGVLAGGIFVKRSADRELEKGAGMSEEMLAPLYDQQKRGETQMAAGAISGAIGLALGLALIGMGARDLKATRGKQSARLRVAPAFGGLVVFGRF